MRFIPKITAKEVKENHSYLRKRGLLYKKKGLAFTKVLKFILKKSGHLHGNILEIGAGSGRTELALAKAGCTKAHPLPKKLCLDIYKS